MRRHPNHLPVLCHSVDGLRRTKLLIPKSLTIGQFLDVARSHCRWASGDSPVSLLGGDGEVLEPSPVSLEALYTTYCGEDGRLHVEVAAKSRKSRDKERDKAKRKKEQKERDRKERDRKERDRKERDRKEQHKEPKDREHREHRADRAERPYKKLALDLGRMVAFSFAGYVVAGGPSGATIGFATACAHSLKGR
eukprot:Skav231073  [mRNA]  locus=scaffold524:248587:249168:+ [translate_table: standard]